uniref:Uncharacterized protein n=1 Tax=Rhizophora mucronata TaxID=61149 RepID=A0A2P2PZG9_RHIMU
MELLENSCECLILLCITLYEHQRSFFTESAAMLLLL